MKNIINEELLRQIELAALVTEKPNHYDEIELGKYFEVSPQTIRRDAERLREMGIDIHSNRRLFFIERKFDLQTLNEMISAYLALNKYDTIKNLNLINNKFKNSTLMIFVKILNAIDERIILEIVYDKNEDNMHQVKYVTPISLTKAGRNIYMIGLENDNPNKFRIYLFEKIFEIKFTDRKSDVKDIPNISGIFRTSWGMFSGGDEYEVKLKFTKKMGEHIKNRFYIETQNITEESDCFILTMKVKLSYEFMSWVMGWGADVEILSPELLKEMVLKKAKEIVKKYK